MLKIAPRFYKYIILFAWALTSCKSNVAMTQPAPINSPTNNEFVPSSYAGLFNYPGCSPYCWIGMEIDVTNFSEASKILTSRYGSQNVQNIDNKNLSWKTHGTDGLIEGYAIFSNNVVVEMSLTFDGNANFTTQNLVEILGEPTWVFVAGQPNNPCWGFDLLYSTQGFYVSLITNKEQKGIAPSQQVFMVRFLQSDITENWNVNDGSLVKWDGYKDYCP